MGWGINQKVCIFEIAFDSNRLQVNKDHMSKNCNVLLSNIENVIEYLKNRNDAVYTCIEECLRKNTSSQRWMVSFEHLEIEDMYQETLIKVYVHSRQKNPRFSDRICAWTTRVFYNTVVDFFRKNNKFSAYDWSDTQVSNKLGIDLSYVDSEIKSFENKDLIAKILPELPTRQRQLLEEHYLDGWEITEIAKIEQKDYTVVQNDKRRALKKLHEILNTKNI